MEDAIDTTIKTHIFSTPHEIDEDGWVTYTWIEEMIPSLLMTALFCTACAAVYAGLF